MLPGPVSFRTPYRRRHPASARRLFDSLLLRARLTNLAVLLLSGVSLLSLLLNLIYYFSYNQPSLIDRAILQSLLSTTPELSAVHLSHSSLDHLVIVPGHAVWKGSDPTKRLDEKEWILEPYQKGAGRLAAFFAHIETAARVALEDEKALVVFSGGQTRPLSTLTEGQSYLSLAILANVFQSPDGTQQPFPRVTTEDYALDSFQNLLFSIARFYERTGKYPQKITVVGYEMKRRRFMELHRAALRWPIEKFHYIGVDAEGDEASQAQNGELRNGYLPYSLDLYGCHTTLLSKRRQRNIWYRFHPYYTTNLALRSLLEWCPGSREGGPGSLYKGPLPWD